MFKFKDFFFLHEILHIDKFNSGDFKYDNSFSKLQPQNTFTSCFWPKFYLFCIKYFIQKHPILQPISIQKGLLGPKFKGFFCFCTNFCSLANLRGLISNMTIVFEISESLFFHKTLRFEKFEGADFKYDNSIFKVLAKK